MTSHLANQIAAFSSPNPTCLRPLQTSVPPSTTSSMLVPSLASCSSFHTPTRIFRCVMNPFPGHLRPERRVEALERPCVFPTREILHGFRLLLLISPLFFLVWPLQFRFLTHLSRPSAPLPCPLHLFLPQYMSLWALTNIAAGKHEHTEYLVSQGAASQFVRMMGSAQIGRASCRERV